MTPGRRARATILRRASRSRSMYSASCSSTRSRLPVSFGRSQDAEVERREGLGIEPAATGEGLAAASASLMSPSTAAERLLPISSEMTLQRLEERECPQRTKHRQLAREVHELLARHLLLGDLELQDASSWSRPRRVQVARREARQTWHGPRRCQPARSPTAGSTDRCNCGTHLARPVPQNA